MEDYAWLKSVFFFSSDKFLLFLQQKETEKKKIGYVNSTRLFYAFGEKIPNCFLSIN
jgi:hypothetical protein